MSRHHLPPEAQIELLRRAFLQLTDPRQLPLPSPLVLKAPEIQRQLYTTMFRDGCLAFPPPRRYRLRVLKRLLASIEGAVTDPEKDEISDDLTASLASLMTEPEIDPLVAAQQKYYVTYTVPSTPLVVASSSPMSPNRAPPQAITILESQDVLASAGTTGRRTWEAALHLGTLLITPEWSARIAGATLLELGAGTGFLAILCAKVLRARYVLATDGSGEVVDDLERNLYLNGLDAHLDASEARDRVIETSVLKWGHAVIDEMLDGNEDGTRTYDLVIGSDLIYDRDAVLPLVMTIRQMVYRNLNAKALISATVRNEATLTLFEETCGQQGLMIQHLSVESVELAKQRGFFHAISMPIRSYLISEAGKAT